MLLPRPRLLGQTLAALNPVRLILATTLGIASLLIGGTAATLLGLWHSEMRQAEAELTRLSLVLAEQTATGAGCASRSGACRTATMSARSTARMSPLVWQSADDDDVVPDTHSTGLWP
jgi:hypothetical protein